MEDELIVVTTRIPKKIVEYVEKISADEHLDKATIYRKFLYQAVEQDRIERAVDLFRREEITLLKAAALADLPPSVFIDELTKRKLRYGIGIEEYKDGLETINSILEKLRNKR